MTGLDVVIEGVIVPVREAARLQRVVDAYAAKDGRLFPFVVRGGTLS